MDSIQAVSSKTTQPAAPSAAANDDVSAAGVFAALLDIVGGRFKSDDASITMDTKLMRGDDAGANDTARNAARDVGKARDDKNDDRAAAKPKDTKSRDDDDKDAADANDAQAAARKDDAAADDAAAKPAQTTPDQVVDMTALEIPVATTEVLAPILIAQQVAAPVETVVTQQAAVETVAAVDEAAPIAAAAQTAATATQKATVVEAPAAVQKAVATTGQNFKQAVVEAAGPAQTVTTDDTAKTAVVASDDTAKTAVVASDDTAGKSKDVAQTTVQTQRSAAAQAQSQDLSRQVDGETKAQVKVTVTNHAAFQTNTVSSVYDIYAGYSNTQASAANTLTSAAADAAALAQNSKTPADATQVQVATASPALAPQAPSPAAQQGPSSSAVRADVAAPAPAQTGGGSGTQTSFGDTGFAGTGSSTQSSATTSTTQTAAAERPLPPAQQIIDQIKVNITRAAKAGLDKVTIQLKPHELGRVDVQLEMSEDHKVRVTVTADNKDTLALLQNDQRTLERALNDAGLRTDSNNLHFSLRSDSDAQNAANEGRNGGKNAAAADNGATDDADDIAMTYDYAEAARVRGGIDTFA